MRSESQGQVIPIFEKLRIDPELEQLRINPELAQIVERARAAQDLHRKENPERVRDYHEDERREQKQSHRALFCAQGWPRLIAHSLVDGRDEHGAELVESEPVCWLRGALAQKKRLLVLVGPVGTGKTMAAALALRSTNMEVRYRRARDIYVLNERLQDDRPALERLQRVEALVIDEMGTSEENERDSAKLEALIQERFDERLFTICISNLKQNPWLDLYGERVSSRMYERGGLFPCKQVMRRGELRRKNEQ